MAWLIVHFGDCELNSRTNALKESTVYITACYFVGQDNSVMSSLSAITTDGVRLRQY
jgi:hypothetical protein